MGQEGVCVFLNVSWGKKGGGGGRGRHQGLAPSLPLPQFPPQFSQLILTLQIPWTSKTLSLGGRLHFDNSCQ